MQRSYDNGEIAISTGPATGPKAAPVIYCIGNFDGVHPGHLALIDQAKALGGPVFALTFAPHPRRYFDGETPPFALTNTAQRDAYLAAAGVQAVRCLPFDADLANLSAQDFARVVLKEKLGVSHVFAGSNFRFGQGRGGDMALLVHLGAALGFAVHPVDLARAGAREVSSSRIRALLVQGDYREATELWQRNFIVQGPVLKGDQLGHTLGFATANLDFGTYLRPAFGVYASRVTLPDGRRVDSVSNLGRRPTVDGIQERFEAHLLDFAEDLYGQTLSVELVGFLRREQKFASLEALKAQIAVDCEAARTMLATIPR